LLSLVLLHCRSVNLLHDTLGVDRPNRPAPQFFFFPLYSPFKVDDNDGFDLGEDNSIKSIYVLQNSLRFELSAVLRPGRFLGNHYIAFTIPNRTFIITMDRVKNGIKAARKAKQMARSAPAVSPPRPHVTSKPDPLKKVDALSTQHRKGFLSRFLDGYLQAEQEAEVKDSAAEELTKAIRDWFSQQSMSTLGIGVGRNLDDLRK
jgi:hypothetical protein